MTRLTVLCQIKKSMHIFGSLVLGCFLFSPSASGAPKPPPRKPPEATPARKGRATLVINGIWRFQTDSGNRGIEAKWSQTPPPSAKDTLIPSLWTTSAARGYSGAAWYWRSFAVPTDWKGQTIRIRFGAVAESATVWLNGVELGRHTGGATPFEFNATQSIKMTNGTDNTLAVRVVGEAQHGAGIWQGVDVVSHDEAYIEQVFPVADAYGRISANISLLNTSKTEGDATLDCVVATVTGPSRVVKKSNQNLHLTPNLNVTTLITSVHGKDLSLWSPGNPVIYSLQLIFRQDKDILDTDEAEFGFRTLGLKDGQISLNGIAVTLKATEQHSELPAVFATPDDTEKARDLLIKAKEAGVTVLYLEAAHPEMLRLADTTGVLVIEGARHGLDASARDAEMRALVLRDQNHPCILGWDAGDCSSQFADSLRQLDASRFIVVGGIGSGRLWAPDKSAPESGPLPSGLLPASR